MHNSIYHKTLRVSALLTALILLFDGGFVVPVTEEMSDMTVSYLTGSVTSVTLGVPPNELNTITAELGARARELDQREAALTEREISSRDFGGDTDYSTYILSAILFVQTLLIVINYFFDWRRYQGRLV